MDKVSGIIMELDNLYYSISGLNKFKNIFTKRKLLKKIRNVLDELLKQDIYDLYNSIITYGLSNDKTTYKRNNRSILIQHSDCFIILDNNTNISYNSKFNRFILEKDNKAFTIEKRIELYSYNLKLWQGVELELKSIAVEYINHCTESNYNE